MLTDNIVDNIYAWNYAAAFTKKTLPNMVIDIFKKENNHNQFVNELIWKFNQVKSILALVLLE
jgi:hypothetical protein